jgi:PAS domain S-box-containing protein
MPRSRTPRSDAGRVFLTAGVALAAVVVLGAVAAGAYARATAEGEKTLEIRRNAGEWLAAEVDAETAVRGYVASGETVFLDPYSAGVARAHAQAARVRDLLAAAKDQATPIDQAEQDGQRSLDRLADMLALIRAGRRADAVALLATGEGKRRMDAFRDDVTALRETQTRLLHESQARARAAARLAVIGSVVLTLFACLVLGLAWRGERAHDRRVTALADQARGRLKALSELAVALAEARTRAEVAEVVVAHGARAAGADTCTLYELDDAGAALVLIGDRGVAPEVLDKIRRITETEGNSAVLSRMKAGAATWAENPAAYAEIYPALAAMPATRPRAQAFWSVPLVAEGRALGLLGVGYYAPRVFPPDERLFIETLSGHCAQALLRAARREREDEARRWLATTLRSIGDAVIATDADGRITFMNPVAETLTGWPASEARGRALEDVFAIFSEQTRARVESPVAKVLREGNVVGLANHTVLRARGGLELPIGDSGAPIRGEGGQIVGVVLVFRDVTLEKRTRARTEFLALAGEALASSIDHQTTLATVARLAVPALADWCSVDLLDVGDRAPRQVAVAHVDENKVRLARELGERYPPDPDAPQGVPQVIRSGKSELYADIPPEMLERSARDAEHGRIIRDLRLRSAMIVPLRVRARTLGAMTFIYAESGRHYTEDDLAFAEDFARRAAMAIENALALRDAEVARAREQALRSAAELANRAKDEFLATVSHELRTPLNAILGWTVLLRRRNPSSDVDRGLATIERNARQQTKLIEDVLDVSRIISGKLVLNVGATSLNDAVGAAIETVTPTAGLKGVELVTDVPEAGLTIVADPDRLQQVIWNLLANAVKFTPKGGRVTVRAGREGSDLWLSVVDTGEGIRRPQLPVLFEPFRQADASTTRRHGGLGLGLAIVRQLVLAHGGTVDADSEGLGLGATFTVRLPARAAVPIVNTGSLGLPAARASRVETNEDIPRLDGLRVLLVDDEPDALTVLAEMLGEQGAEVHVASTSRDALERMGEVLPHVLVSDIGMPEMDGFTLIQRIRALPSERGGDTRAIALTAFARAEDVRRALAAGYQVHLAKPVELPQLANAIVALGRVTAPAT